ncbi:hypothetical protein DAPPUDRAFT_115457 [Daphnia pulex]|uniref:AMP-dependent synthetase/ligase domain-containing protein n=1 Tax=Daphnia pulex TaxID=6669 RepID=E9HLE7_DAPPU|nr:hypothetical protein DAPPUDRAFT_115457 [Daphnia pulex]|eukprot:EFX67425.1 hypothetical protein DAPPUDRAFT_115457 [Daphnia pulex]
MGYKKGEVFGIISPNIPEFPIVLYGASGAGMPVSLVNPTFTAEEMARQLSAVGATALFGVAPMAETLKQVARLCPAIRHVILLGPPQDGAVSFQLMAQDSAGDLFNETLDINVKEDIFLLPHSSGTSGLPKSVMNMGFQTGAKLVTLPQFERTFGRVYENFFSGEPLVVPPLVSLLAQHPALKVESLSQTHTITCGAAPLSVKTSVTLIERLNNPNLSLQEGYGLSETFPGVLMAPLGNTKLGSCGAPISRSKAKVINHEIGDQALGPYQHGELYVSGWLRTGDVAYYDDDGNFYIVDRLKELIKVKGLQVAPAELEDMPSLESPTNTPVNSLELTSSGNREWSRSATLKFRHLSTPRSHKQIKGGIEFCAAIPKNNMGKILRRELRVQYANSQSTS